jgi:hypothetical protein
MVFDSTHRLSPVPTSLDLLPKNNGAVRTARTIYARFSVPGAARMSFVRIFRPRAAQTTAQKPGADTSMKNFQKQWSGADRTHDLCTFCCSWGRTHAVRAIFQPHGMLTTARRPIEDRSTSNFRSSATRFEIRTFASTINASKAARTV